jgi:hypothetical protein
MRADEDTTPVFSDRQTFALHDLERVADGHPSDAVMLHELSFRVHLVAFGESSPLDRITDVIGDLSKKTARSLVESRSGNGSSATTTPQLAHTCIAAGE